MAFKLNDMAYYIGNLFLKKRVKCLGAEAMVHYSTLVKNGGNISIGKGVEIRRGCELDGRIQKTGLLEIGDYCRIKEYCTIASYGGSIKIGLNCLIGRNCTIFGHGDVEIGEYTMLSPNVSIISSNHIATDSEDYFQSQGFTREQISIGDGVWLGTGVVVLAGVRVCSRVVVGAGSVVNKSIEAPGIYAGSPAKFISELPANASNKEIYYVNWGLN